MTSVRSASSPGSAALAPRKADANAPAGTPALPPDIKVVATDALAATKGNSASVPGEVSVALIMVPPTPEPNASATTGSSDGDTTVVLMTAADSSTTIVATGADGGGDASVLVMSSDSQTATLVSQSDSGTVVTSLPLPPSLAEQAAGLPIMVWEAQRLGTGNAVLDLDGGYRLIISQANNELSIFSPLNNSTTRIWGDAQIDAATGRPLQFWGTMSFELATGAIITVRTAQSPDNPQCYQLDSVAVSQDARAIIIHNANSSATGDLVIDASQRGWDVDDAFADGLLLLEQQEGWVSEDAVALGQELLDLTGLDGRLKPGTDMLSLREVVKVISSTFAQMAYFSSAQQRLSSTQNLASEQRRNDADRAAVEKAALMKAMLRHEADVLTARDFRARVQV